MQRAVRNLGRDGLAATAISAVDVALWDLKAKLLDLPLASLLGRAARGGADLWQRRVHHLQRRPARAAACRLGRARRLPLGQDEDRHRTRARPAPRRRREGGDRDGGVVRGRQRRLFGAAGAAHGGEVRATSRTCAGSRSRCRRTTWTACAACANGAAGAWKSPPANMATHSTISAGCSAPARWTCNRRMRRAAAASPGSCGPRRCARRITSIFRHIARRRCICHLGLRGAAVPPSRVVPRPRPDRADAVRWRAGPEGRRDPRRTCPARDWVWLQAAGCRAVRGRRRSGDDRRTPTRLRCRPAAGRDRLAMPAASAQRFVAPRAVLAPSRDPQRSRLAPVAAAGRWHRGDGAGGAAAEPRVRRDRRSRCWPTARSSIIADRSRTRRCSRRWCRRRCRCAVSAHGTADRAAVARIGCAMWSMRWRR